MNIYVGNLPYNTDEEGLHNMFAEYGDVSSAKIISDRETGRSRGFGFVEMEDDGAAEAAIESLHGAEFDGRNLVVNEARPKRSNDNDRRGSFRRERY